MPANSEQRSKKKFESVSFPLSSSVVVIGPNNSGNLDHTWWNDSKISDDWLDNIFPEFYRRLGISQDFFKRDYYQLIALMEVKDIPEEIGEKLDIIYREFIISS